MGGDGAILGDWYTENAIIGYWAILYADFDDAATILNIWSIFEPETMYLR